MVNDEIYGIFDEVVPLERFKMRQVVREWLPEGQFRGEYPRGKTSLVEIGFEADATDTILTVKQQQIPEYDWRGDKIEVAKLEDGWRKQLMCGLK